MIHHPFLGRGFRPFFLFGALHAVISLFLWGGYYSDVISPPDFVETSIFWHAHEMVYGFTMAIVAGFLLTAVANWTGSSPTRNIHLLFLVVVWILGRLVMTIDLSLPTAIVWAVELMFVPCLALSLLIPLVRKWNKRNFVFLFLLCLLFVCDLFFLKFQETQYLYSATMIIIMMISLVGGRVIPAFTMAALRRRNEEAYQTPQPKKDFLALILLVCMVVLTFFNMVETYLMAAVAGVTLCVHLLRLRHYQTKRILNDPMVWVLHLGYIWLLVGLLFFSLSKFELVTLSTGFHAFTAGAIGTMTLGMMVRVSLGHTGRTLIADKLTVTAFTLMQLAIVLRIAAPMFNVDNVMMYISISAYLWSASFALYLWRYAPMLWRARPDGRPA